MFHASMTGVGRLGRTRVMSRRPLPCQGISEPWRCDFRQATMMAVVDEPRVRRTAGMLTAGPVFPWGGDALFPHIGVLTRRPAKLEDDHGDLRDPAGEQLSGSWGAKPG